jgi:hypothetical protein
MSSPLTHPIQCSIQELTFFTLCRAELRRIPDPTDGCCTDGGTQISGKRQEIRAQ